MIRTYVLLLPDYATPDWPHDACVWPHDACVCVEKDAESEYDGLVGAMTDVMNDHDIGSLDEIKPLFVVAGGKDLIDLIDLD